jgi:hypothetical protein
VKVPSFAVTVPKVALLKKTLAFSSGALVSIAVTLPVMVPACANSRILPNLLVIANFYAIKTVCKLKRVLQSAEF